MKDSMIEVSARVIKGHYNWANLKDVGYRAIINFGEHTLSMVLDNEPDWRSCDLPSELVDEIESELNEYMYHGKRKEIEELIKLYRENQDVYDSFYCLSQAMKTKSELDAWLSRVDKDHLSRYWLNTRITYG